MEIRMQDFIRFERAEQKKRNVLERIKDYNEIYDTLGTQESSNQASRCVQCGDPYCLNKCPLHNFIPYWLKRVSEQDLEMAFMIANESSPFPEIMGRVCPHDRLCEGDCTLEQDNFGAIMIGAIETYISEEGFKKGLKPKTKELITNKKVAIIGSGPAGLSAATFLLRSGVEPHIYERANRAGGLLTYGIPGFKLEKEIVQRRVDLLEEFGAKFFFEKEVGKSVDFGKLLKDYDAVFLGIGATKAKKAGIANEEAQGCYEAMDFLTSLQSFNFGITQDKIDVKDKRVVVIGGGDTTMDCARSSIREGAKNVTVLYRRDEANMPGSKKEVKNAKEEGAEFSFLSSPVEVLVDSGQVVGLRAEKTELGEPDSSGRQSCEVVKGSEFDIECDVVIFALGFDCENPAFLEKNSVSTDKWGRILVNNDFQTSNEKVYAGGDCYRGANLVVRAAYDGREAAKAIVKRLL